MSNPVENFIGQQKGAKPTKKTKEPLPKLFKDDKNSIVLKSINGVYKVLFIAKKMLGSVLWYSSIVFVIYIMPYQLLMLKD